MPDPSLDLAEDLSQVLVRRFLRLCEHPRSSERMLRLVRGAGTDEATGRRLYRVINRTVLHPWVQRTALPASTTRWELVASQLIGIGVLRYVVRLEPMASADVEEVVALATPSIRALIQPTTAPQPPARPARRRLAPLPRVRVPSR